MKAKTILRERQAGDRFDGDSAKGCIALYRATGEKEYRDEALSYADSGVLSEATVHLRDPVQAAFSFGKAFLFAYEETKNERFLAVAKTLREALRTSGLSTPRELYMTQPFIAEYDTRFGDRQSYKTIARTFGGTVHPGGEGRPFYQRVCALPEERELYPLKQAGYMLMAAVDTVEQMDIQLYEHYRVLADLFLETVRGLMPYRLAGTGLFSREITDQDEPDIEGSLMAVYALFKGVRLGLLDEEKYLPIADEMRYCLESVCNTLVCFAEFPAGAGLRLMAEAEIREAGIR
ncbi:MAG: glycoside hydrolase family 88 protein [Clostridia bacterium]|nr:glycoside hydrolase family 88 protein [Clostridia bacterium]